METNLKRTKIIYWVTTGLLAVFIIPGIFFLNSDFAKEGTRHLGLPMWFHWELGIAKFLGGLILILPGLPRRLKEWAYVAFGIDFISAFIGIIAVDGAGGMWWSPLITMALLIVSFITFLKMNRGKVEGGRQEREGGR
ncbi:MAG: DoxX family protein [Sphingobacteriales bacterium]|nr:MAG: DoxX family protein [Sphingobacteriales bacterium]